MAMDRTYEDLQRAEEELGKWRAGVEERDELLRQAYGEIKDLRVELAKWTAGVTERQTLLTDAYREIAEKDKVIRGLKERVAAVGKVTTDMGSPGEPPVRPTRVRVVADQEPGGGTSEPTGPPPLPQRLLETEEEVVVWKP